MNTKKCIELLAKAIERVTVNTYAEQGALGADEVFKLLEQVESEIKTGECGENQKTTEAPQKTNFDRITENEGALAAFIVNNTSNCYHCFLGIDGKCEFALKYLGDEACLQSIIEWLQKECE